MTEPLHEKPKITVGLPELEYTVPAEVSEIMAAIKTDQQIDWETAWVRAVISEDRYDCLRYGHRSADGRPGFSSIIVYRGEPSGTQAWRCLVDERQFQAIVECL